MKKKTYEATKTFQRNIGEFVIMLYIYDFVANRSSASDITIQTEM